MINDVYIQGDYLNELVQLLEEHETYNISIKCIDHIVSNVIDNIRLRNMNNNNNTIEQISIGKEKNIIVVTI